MSKSNCQTGSECICHKMEAQTWICPKCHDDHQMGKPCTPESGMFMPANSDQSYIADQYRKRVSELSEEKEKGLEVFRGMAKRQGELKEELSMANKETEAEHQRYLDAVNLAVIVRNQANAQLTEVQDKHDDLYRILVNAIRLTNAGPYTEERFNEVNDYLRTQLEPANEN